MTRARLDQLVVQRGLVESREKAQRLIRAGSVRVADQPATKPGHLYRDDAVITLDEAPRFVGRGGEKLEQALDEFGIRVNDMVCMDIGASTGGFTDCLLQRGARRVFAIDVGKGQLHWNLRQDKRVTVLEGVNARHLEQAWFDEQPAFAVLDVSFISLTKILPAVTTILAPGAGVVTLIKPQFEAGREEVGKGGVVRDKAVHDAVVEKVRRFGTDELGWAWQGQCVSPIRGPAGNVEFLAYWRKE